MYLHSPRNGVDCELVVTCYFLWKNEVSSSLSIILKSDIYSFSYQDIMLDILRARIENATIEDIPHLQLNKLREFYTFLAARPSPSLLSSSLHIDYIDIIGLFHADHSPLFVPFSPSPHPQEPFFILGTNRTILFSSRASSSQWTPSIGELSCACDATLHGDFFIRCMSHDATRCYFEYGAHTALLQGVGSFASSHAGAAARSSQPHESRADHCRHRRRRLPHPTPP